MTTSDKPHIRLDSVSVDYGNHIGIRNVSLDIQRGEMFALVGDHGAGKTTITRLLCGAIRPDSGAIFVDGNRYDYLTPKNAIHRGIVAIHQDVMLVPALSAYENIFLNREKRKNLLYLDHAAMKNRLHEALRILGADDIDIHRPIDEYRRDRQQLIDLARIVCFPSEMIIIDEISARLSPSILENIHHILSVLRNQGCTILYISHDMREVVDFSSRIAVLRNGRLNRVVAASDVDEVQLMQLTYSSLRRRQDLEEDNVNLFYQKTFTENVIQRFPLPTLVIDTDKRIRIANTNFCRAFALRSSDLVGLDFENLTLFPTELRNRLDSSLASQPRGTVENPDLPVRQGGAAVSLHFYKLFDDESFLGTVFFLEVAEKCIGIPAGSDWQEKEIPDVKRQLRHEINNALGTILNHIQIARTPNNRENLNASLVTIEEETKRIRRIVQAKTTPLVGDNHLKPLVQRVCSLVTALVMEKQIDLTWSLEPDLAIPIPADRLQQILLNLLFNSIDAVSPGGIISIVARVAEIGDGVFVEFVVADNGCGIATSDIQYIFSPFYSTKKSDSGHGVGLALCKSIVDSYGGSFNCRSSEDSGTEMRFYLPLDVQPTPGDTIPENNSRK